MRYQVEFKHAKCPWTPIGPSFTELPKAELFIKHRREDARMTGTEGEWSDLEYRIVLEYRFTLADHRSQIVLGEDDPPHSPSIQDLVAKLRSVLEELRKRAQNADWDSGTEAYGNAANLLEDALKGGK